MVARSIHSLSPPITRFSLLTKPMTLVLLFYLCRQHHVIAHGSPPVNLEKILEDFTQQQLVEDVECPK